MPAGRRERRRARRRPGDGAVDDHAPDGGRGEEEKVSLGDDEHAWWASRDELEHGWRPPPPKPPPSPPETKTAFEEYFSTESLFVATDPDAEGSVGEGHELVDGGPWADPYAVLGLRSTATWDEISNAHRRLAKLHHPDRLFGASEEDRARSERRMQEANRAYSELRQRRRSS